MSTRNRYATLIGLVAVVAVVVGVLVWPPPEKALALTLFECKFDWDQHGWVSDTEIAEVIAEYLDDQGEVIQPHVYTLEWNRTEGQLTSYWNALLPNPPGEAFFVRFTATSEWLNFGNGQGVSHDIFVELPQGTIWVQ